MRSMWNARKRTQIHRAENDHLALLQELESTRSSLSERVEADWKVYEKYAEHKWAYADSQNGKKLANIMLALFQEYLYNPP